jgi:hypothetical protein
MGTQHVVKGGVGPPPRGVWSIQTFPEGGVILTGTTVHSEPERTVAELAAWTATRRCGCPPSSASGRPAGTWFRPGGTPCSRTTRP